MSRPIICMSMAVACVIVALGGSARDAVAGPGGTLKLEVIDETVPEPLGGAQFKEGARLQALDPKARPVFDLTDLSRSKLDEADRLRRQQQ